MTYSVCSFNYSSAIEMKDLFVSKKKIGKDRTIYHMSYMIQHYEIDSMDYVQWLVSKMELSSGEIGVQLGSFYEDFGTRIFNRLHFLSEIKIIGETRESSLRLKASLKSIIPHTYFTENLESNIEDKSVGVVYTLVRRKCNEITDVFLIEEVLRMLKDQGRFYITHIVEDYELAIELLCHEFDSSYKLDSNEHSKFEEMKLLLSKHFNHIEVNEYVSTMEITKIDDLIAHILSSESYIQMRLIIARTGLSAFRMFLIKKLDSAGAIIIERRLKLTICTK